MTRDESRWPALPVADWAQTRDTVHMWTQIVGKVRLALAPPANQWWHVPLYVTATGLTTSLMPYRGTGLEIAFDFLQHRLVIQRTTGERREIELAPRSTADFYAEFRARLRELDVEVEINPRPVEVAESIPFADDEVHASYDPAAIHRFWLSLVSADEVFSRFRGEFRGKASPVHFFWGAFDLAVTRFSGRPAAPHPGGIPNCPDSVMLEAYNEEVSSCGYWPGGAEEGAFYAYAYPEPDGYRTHPVAGATYDTTLGEFLLPYKLVREADDPDELLLTFLRSAHEAAAKLGNWREAVTG